MTVTARDRMRRTGGKKVNTAAMTESLDDLKQHVCIGVVTGADGDHYEVTSGAEGADVLVEVSLMPTEQLVTCRLASQVGGAGFGLWRVPAIGTEVVVGFPDGGVENGGVILGCLSTGSVPEGFSETIAVLVVPAGGKLIIRDGSSGDQEIAYKSDVDALAAWAATHLHQGSTENAPTGGPIGVGTSTLIALKDSIAPGNPPHDTYTAGSGSSPPDAVGTSVLRAK